MDETKTVKQIIEAAFVGKRVRFPNLTQDFQREEVHTIEKIQFTAEDFPDDEPDPDEPDVGVSVVFATSKPKTHPHDAEKAWVYYELTSPIEFVSEPGGAQEKLHPEVYARPECVFNYCPNEGACRTEDKCLHRAPQGGRP